ncbi:MAG: hypothetical protein M1826_004554 [Phylliscum demangeonii]|nr:MAG: hypothetical protein M1826_004554 [Phylliscum demangeonii]
MLIRRRYAALFLIPAILTCAYVVYRPTSWQWRDQIYAKLRPAALSRGTDMAARVTTSAPAAAAASAAAMASATPGPVPAEATRVLVVARLQADDVSWIGRELPGVLTAIYTIDDRSAGLRPPTSKGAAAMVYLTYLLDHYDWLPDVIIFARPHPTTWHNNELLDSSTAQTVRHLSSEHVLREGYFNLRCHWRPGCPEALPLNANASASASASANAHDAVHAEDTIVARAWTELFPTRPVPGVVAQACCGQFAVSREAVRAVSRPALARYRDWLLHTDLDDGQAGRVFDSLWHVIFRGQTRRCPAMHACYCDGYGVCFGSGANMDAWFRVRDEQRALLQAEPEPDPVRESGGNRTAAGGVVSRIDAMEQQLRREKRLAWERGKEARNRALEAGRRWQEGDGF